jgi:preprotein translocase subunit SecY
MLQAFLNIWKIAELRNKILFTISMLAVFRLGHWVPLPGINQEELRRQAEQAQQSGDTFAAVANFITMFSGGSLSHSTIFGLGVMPYISASIIFQLLTATSPRLKKLQEEGPTGRQQIMQWTRYATIVLAVIQAIGWLQYLRGSGFIYSEWSASPVWWVMAVTVLTAGCVFLMWIGEQIDKYGIGNGVSMIIMAGILTQMPNAISTLYTQRNEFGAVGLLLVAAGFVIVVAGSVLLTVAQRRVPVQQAKHTRGRKVFGGQRSYLPLRVNHSGVMPVVFASSLMIFPSIIFGALAENSTVGTSTGQTFGWLRDQFAMGAVPYVFFEVILIYFFSYFWITVQFNPEEMAKQLRDNGSFIPGLRPGPRTAEYLETVMERITFVGAGFLAVIAVIPQLVSHAYGIPFAVTQFLGGTGLLIVVSVVLDFMQRVEANLLMRNYAGFLASAENDRGPRLQSTRSM